MDCERFIETFGNIIEHCQLGSAAVWASRPFDSLHGLHTSFCNFLDGLPVNGKEHIEFKYYANYKYILFFVESRFFYL